MAAGRNILGKLDTNFWINEIKNSKNKQDAINIVGNMMDAAGYLGITDNDQKAVVTVLDVYGKQYGTDGLERIYNIWDPSKNHINKSEYNSGYKTMWEEIANDPYIYYTGASIPATDSRKLTDIANDRQAKDTVVSINSDGTKNTFADTLYKIYNNKVNTTNKINNQKNVDNTGGTGTTTNTPAPQYTDLSGLYDIIKNLNQKIYDLEHPYIPTADELAERYGYTNDIDEDWLLNNLYNPKTDEYYKNALDYFDKVRTETTSDALAYERGQLQDYLNSYNYQAPTGANRSVKAANVMRNQLGGNQTMSDLDSQLLDQYNNIQDAYNAELASNPYQAKSHANSLRTWLANNSATINASNVKQYVAELDAYADMYAAGRELGNYINKANATKYSGLVNAQSTNAKAAADGYASNAFDRMYNWYNVINNGNKALTNSEIGNYIKSSTGKVS